MTKRAQQASAVKSSRPARRVIPAAQGPGYRIDNPPGALGGLVLNTAPTDFAASTVTTHAPVPVHAPVQPPNVDPAPAVAVSVTEVPIV